MKANVNGTMRSRLLERNRLYVSKETPVKTA